MADLISKIKGLDNVTYDLKDEVSIFGETNLLENTTTWVSASNATSQGSFSRVNDATAPGGTYVLWTCTTAGSAGGPHMNTTVWGDYNSKMINGQNYIFSVWVNCSAAKTFATFNPERFSPIIKSSSASVAANTWTRIWRVGTFNTSTSYQSCPLYVSGGWTVGQTMKIACPKLELGNKPTDWSPAPEDLARYASETITFFQ